MTTNRHDDDHDNGHDHGSAPITDTVHDNSWSANLGKPQYQKNPELAVHDSIAAIEHTAAENHVNLVTHTTLGHPSSFLYDALAEEYQADEIEWAYVEQCGCGGHMTRVTGE